MPNRTDNIPNEFQRKGLELVNQLLPLSESVFYLVEPDMSRRGVVVFNSNLDMDKQYDEKFSSLDPLNPERLSNRTDRVITLDSLISPHMLKKTIYFQEFLAKHNHRYVADMFFRQEGHIVAILSMLREESLGNYTEAELELLNNVQPFLEYSLNLVYLPQRQQQRTSVKDKYALTERELDVVELLLSGFSNKEVAEELNLGLATVKTHLHHIFQKTNVQSRSELVINILQDLQS